MEFSLCEALPLHLPGQDHPGLAVEDELALSAEKRAVLLEVVLLHLARSSEQLGAPRHRAEEEDEVLVEQAVDVEGDWVRETAATLLTDD